MSTNDKDEKVQELFSRAQAATARILDITDDLERAHEYKDVPRPQPRWWWRLISSKRRDVYEWNMAQIVMAEGPQMLNVAENEQKEATKALKMNHRLIYAYKVTPAGFHSWLTPLGSDEVVLEATM